MTEQALTAPRAGSAPLYEVLRWLEGSADGLSGAEASARLLRYGPNAVRTHRVSAIAVLGRQLRSAVLGLLAVTFVIGRVIPIDPRPGDRRRARDRAVPGGARR